MYYIQQSNTKTKPAKTLDLSIADLNDSEDAKISNEDMEKSEL